MQAIVGATRAAFALAGALATASGCGQAASEQPAEDPNEPVETVLAEPEGDAPEPPDEDEVALIRISYEQERAIDEAAATAIAAGQVPGAVVAIGRADGVIFTRAYGRRAVRPEAERMTLDTVFDLASVTKPVATASSVMRLVERGAIDLDAPVVEHIPELGTGGRERITARHLLTHTSGLPPVNSLRDYSPRERAMAQIYRVPLESSPGAQVRYSDLGFIVLGELVQRVSGDSLDVFARRELFEPLGMEDTGFTPEEARLPRIAPTERAARRDNTMIRGEVHDPRAWRLGGVAGNAGLFSTSADLSLFARAMLQREGPLTRETVDAMVRPRRFVGGTRGLGWDVGHTTLGPRAFGHGGYTGTSVWMSDASDTFVVVLTNRVHPSGGGDAQPLIAAVQAIALEAAAQARPPEPPVVRPGIEVLRREGFARVRGRVALLTHDAARAFDGRRTLDVLHEAEEVEVVRVMSPEHGLNVQREGRVLHGRDRRTGLSVSSLFGGERRPTPAMLQGIDAVVIDLQDVGVRFYTYAATVRRVLEAAAERDLRVVLLDRPDPLGGRPPVGPVLRSALASFVNHHPLPTRHGMTLGELSALINEDRGIGAELEVVPVEGWRREMSWEQTGLRWVPPSPNLRTPAQTELYPALGLLESTNVSVGRGTEHPFERLGAPWMNPARVLAALGEVEGVTITVTRFRPRSGPHRNETVPGLAFELTDREALRPVRLGLRLAQALREVHHNAWDAVPLVRMVGDRAVVDPLLEGASVESLEEAWAPRLDAFAETRERHLRYR